jgi:hypothetical protein
MSVDLHSTQVLNKVIDNLPDRTTFLVDMFFPEVNVSDAETIMFDTTSGRKLVAAFVSPLAPARLTADLGYETDSFRPAYVKDLRQFDPKKGSKRLPGEKIGGAMSPMERIKKAIKANLNEQLDMISGRMEVMAGEIITTGKVTISGERYPTKVLDFKRRAENNVVKTGGARWGEAGVSPYNDLDAESQELSDATGFGATDVIFGLEAWKLYYADFVANHKDKLDKTIENGGMAEVLMGYIRQPRDGVTYRGRNGYLRFWTYTGTYTDPETGVTNKTLGDYDVIIGGASIDGVRHFGAIQDFEADLQARQYFASSWVERNPSRLHYLMQSAPLLVPYRRNNVKRLKVR